MSDGPAWTFRRYMAAQKKPEAEPADGMTNVESAVTRSSVITLTGVTTSSGRLFQAMGRGDDDGSAFDQIYDVGKKEEWLVDGDEVQVLQESHLGSGSFGQVMKGTYYGVPVAVKISTRMSVEIDPQLFNELRVFRRLRHPNIVGFYGAVFSSSKDVALVLELVQGPTLCSFIRQKDKYNSVVNDSDRSMLLIRGICSALWYLHGKRPSIIHGDLKPNNILVEITGADGSWSSLVVQPKLLDFGLARMLTKSTRKVGGTLRYMAPEVLLGYFQQDRPRPTTAIDVFSLGRLIHFTLTGKQPFEGLNSNEVIERIKDSSRSDLQWPEIGAASTFTNFRCVVNQCIEVDASLRPTVAEVFKLLPTNGQDWQRGASVEDSFTDDSESDSLLLALRGDGVAL